MQMKESLSRKIQKTIIHIHYNLMEKMLGPPWNYKAENLTKGTSS